MKHAAKALLGVIAVAAATAATPVAAQLQFGRMDTGLYLGGAVGASKFKDSCNGAPAGISCDDNDVAWKAFAGWQFNRYIGIEGGYVDLGRAKASVPGVVLTAKARGVELVAVGSVPLSDRFALYGKAGGIRSRVSVNGPGVSGSETSTDFTFGAGVRYNFVRNFGARLEWQRYLNVGGGSVGDDTIDMFSLGLLYNFY